VVPERRAGRLGAAVLIRVGSGGYQGLPPAYLRGYQGLPRLHLFILFIIGLTDWEPGSPGANIYFSAPPRVSLRW